MQIHGQQSVPDSHYSQFGQLHEKPLNNGECSGSSGISCQRWIENGELFHDSQQTIESSDLLMPDELFQVMQSVNGVARLTDKLVKQMDNAICEALQPRDEDHSTLAFADVHMLENHQWESTLLADSFDVSHLEALSNRFNELNFVADKHLVDQMVELPGARAIPQLEVIASFKHNPLLLAQVESIRLSTGFAAFCDQMLKDIEDLKVALQNNPDALDAFRGVLFYSLDKIFTDAGATLEALCKRSQDRLLRLHLYRLAHAANSLPVQEALARLDMNHLPTVFGVLNAEYFEDATSYNHVIGCLYFKSAKNAQYIRLCHELGPKISGLRAAIEPESQCASRGSGTLMGRLSQKHIDLIVYGIKSKLTSSQLRQYINQLIDDGHLLPELKQ